VAAAVFNGRHELVGERLDGEPPEIDPLAAYHLQQEVERPLEALDA
jgi:hypothetical protein